MDGNERLIPLGVGKSELERNLRTFRPSSDQEHARRLGKRLEKRPVASIYEEYLLNALQPINLGLPELAVVQAVMTIEWFFNEIMADRLVRPVQKQLVGAPSVVKDHVQARLGFSGSREPLTNRVKVCLKLLGVPPIQGGLWANFLDVVARRNRIVHQLSRRDVSSEEAQAAVSCGLELIDVTMTALLKMTERRTE